MVMPAMQIFCITLSIILILNNAVLLLALPTQQVEKLRQLPSRTTIVSDRGVGDIAQTLAHFEQLITETSEILAVSQNITKLERMPAEELLLLSGQLEQ